MKHKERAGISLYNFYDHTNYIIVVKLFRLRLIHSDDIQVTT